MGSATVSGQLVFGQWPGCIQVGVSIVPQEENSDHLLEWGRDRLSLTIRPASHFKDTYTALEIHYVYKISLLKLLFI